MDIGVNQEGRIRLSEVFVPIELVGEHARVLICERDGVFEIIAPHREAVLLFLPALREIKPDVAGGGQ